MTRNQLVKWLCFGFATMCLNTVAHSSLGAEAAETDGKSQVNSVDESVEEPLPLAGYDKGIFIQSPDGKFKSVLNAMLQARFTYENAEELDDTGDIVREDEYHFSLPRVRVKLKGHAFSKIINYSMQVELGKGNSYLKDFYVDAAFLPKVLHLTIGQFKPAYTRQQIMSPGKLEFNNAALATSKLTCGFDLGLMLHNNYKKVKGLEWALAIVNGTGDKPWFKPDVDEDTGELTEDSKFTNVPNKFVPSLVARLGYNFGGLKGYSEADLEGGGPRFGIGAGGYFGLGAGDNPATSRVAVDAMLKVQGFSLAGAFYLAMAGDELNGQSYAADGVYAQAGYVIAKIVQPVVRYSFYDPDGAQNAEQEFLGGVSIYFFGHNVKWQTEGGSILYNEGDLQDYAVRSQLQLSF